MPERDRMRIRKVFLINRPVNGAAAGTIPKEKSCLAKATLEVSGNAS
ncbi:MAG: hypothetical protein ACXWV6_08085 [Chitinophagaceae bacterium]